MIQLTDYAQPSEAYAYGVTRDRSALIGDGLYRDVYHREGDYWAFKKDWDGESNRTEVETARSWFISKISPVVRVPRTVYFPVTGILAMQYIAGEFPHFPWDECNCFANDMSLCHTKVYDHKAYFEDMHLRNFKMWQGHIYVIDMGGGSNFPDVI